MHQVVVGFFLLLSLCAWPIAHWAGTLVCPSTPIRVAFDDRGYNYFDGKGFDQDWRCHCANAAAARCALPNCRVRRNPGAVAYVTAQSLDASVRTVLLLKER